MLKAHSRLFEHLALATDLGLIAGCWLGTYALRFHVFGSGGDIPPFRDYALQLVPILLVWGFAYKVLDLYRPLRLGSHLSEWFDVAKASTLGVPRPHRHHDLHVPRLSVLAARHRRVLGRRPS